jgi:glycogen(starch) synthase
VQYVSRQLTKAVIAHFHEWQVGVAISLCRKRHIDVTTVFTTHATLLGRYLCAGSVDFYNNLQYFDVDHEAGKRGIYHRYCIERSSAHCADVFTTVSHITAYESEHLLKRKPDGVLPNGLNVVKFQAMHEFQNLHATAKAKINEFVRGHFYGHYNFDLENTLYVGPLLPCSRSHPNMPHLSRCLLRVDTNIVIRGWICSSSRWLVRTSQSSYPPYPDLHSGLNYRLLKSQSRTCVVAFIIMPATTHSYTVDALKGQAVTKQLRDTVTEIQNRIGARLFDHAIRSNGFVDSRSPRR